MGQVPAKSFPSPTSFGQAPLNGVLQAKTTPQAPAMQFPSLNYQQGAVSPSAGLSATGTLKMPKPPQLKPTGGLKGLG